jgi:hypothetical protein
MDTIKVIGLLTNYFFYHVNETMFKTEKLNSILDKNEYYYCTPYQYEMFRKYSHRIINAMDWSFKENYYYYYTSIYNARLILKEMKISCSMDSSSATYGGFFLSKINPKENNDELISFYENVKYIQVVFAIIDKDIECSRKKRVKKNFWFISSDIDLNLCYFFIILNNV